MNSQLSTLCFRKHAHTQKLHTQRLLKLCNAVDFNDLLDASVKLLEQHHSILQQLQRQRPFLLVDEFQDSNKPQANVSVSGGLKV